MRTTIFLFSYKCKFPCVSGYVRGAILIWLGLISAVCAQPTTLENKSAQADASRRANFNTKIIPGSGMITAIAWSPDGRYLSVSDRQDLRISLWDVETRQVKWRVTKRSGVPVRNSKNLDFGIDGNTVITSSAILTPTENRDVALSVISTATGKFVTQVPYPLGSAGPSYADTFSLSSDRQSVLAYLAPAFRVAYFDAISWRVKDEYKWQFIGGLRRVLLDEKRHRLMLVGDRAPVEVWDLNHHDLLSSFRTTISTMADAVLNPASGELITAGTGNETGGWKPGTQELERLQDDWKTIVRSWDPITGQLKKIYAGPGSGADGIAVSPDGHKIAATKGRSLPDHTPAYLIVWNADTTEIEFSIDCGNHLVGAVAFSPDGRRLAYVVEDQVRVLQIP
jgi:WD40 repeat protein